MAENQYPVDEFDQLAATRKVRGAHRRKETSFRWWIALVAVLVFAPLLGWGLVHLMGDEAPSGGPTPTATAPAGETSPAEQSGEPTTPAQESPTEEPPAEPTPEPVPVNYDLPVEVYNASEIAGYAAASQEILWNAGFASVATGNYPTLEMQLTQVFYPNEDSASTANEVAAQLGIPQDEAHVILGGEAEGRDLIVVVLAGELG